MSFERTLVISDIHGCYREFKDLLLQTSYDARKDRLILLGDYVSRGPCSHEVVELVMQLVKENGAIALQGNHDHRFVRVMEDLASEMELQRFFEKGGIDTISSYCQVGFDQAAAADITEVRSIINASFRSHIDFLKQLPFYYEDEHCIYVHAGLNPVCDKLSEQSIQDLLYIKEAFYLNATNAAKVVLFGHTVTVDIHGSYDIWLGGDKIGMDGGCAFGGQLNCLELVDGQVNKCYSRKAFSTVTKT